MYIYFFAPDGNNASALYTHVSTLFNFNFFFLTEEEHGGNIDILEKSPLMYSSSNDHGGHLSASSDSTVSQSTNRPIVSLLGPSP